MLHHRWVQLPLLAVSQWLAMALWFSASAVGDQLKTAWRLDAGEQAWLTMSVQFGFVVGALVSAVLNLADRWSPHRLIAVSAACGAAANGVIPLLITDSAATGGGFAVVIILRFTTGMALAGVYPPAMKIVATWFKSGRGLAIGIMVGALTLGSASPHLFKALTAADSSTEMSATGEQPAALAEDVNGDSANVARPGANQESQNSARLSAANWRTVLSAASLSALLSAVLTIALVRPGPLLPARSPFDVGYALRAWKNLAVRRANFGYLGHMWELYAMWSTVPLFLAGVCRSGGWSNVASSFAAFATIGIGGVGCVLAGAFADRLGRCRITIWSMAISGGCALVAGFLPVDLPWLLVIVCLVWGLTVVADSAQFSAAVSELCEQEYVGTALTLQTSAGFLLSAITIRVVPWLQTAAGNETAFAVLAIGPAFGIWHMARLRRMPEASQMASGAK